MRIIFYIFCCTICLNACFPQKALDKPFSSDILQIKPLSKDLYLHVSYLQTESFGKVPCNGAVYINNKEALIFDTPTDAASSDTLIHLLEQKGIKIKALIATHFHEDCLGGLSSFHKKNIPSYANYKTFQLLKNSSATTYPSTIIQKDTIFSIGKQTVELKYYGEGHTQDNIVGYMPNEKALFGGCLIKSLGSGKGYLGDANTEEWSNTVRKIRADLSDLKQVIPGHGKPGDASLLDYTIDLFGVKN